MGRNGHSIRDDMAPFQPAGGSLLALAVRVDQQD